MTGSSCGIDVGGTKIAGGVTDRDGSILEERTVGSPAHDEHALVTAIAGLISDLPSRHDVECVGIGAAGYVDRHRARIPSAPKSRVARPRSQGRDREAGRAIGRGVERRQRRCVGRVHLWRRQGRRRLSARDRRHGRRWWHRPRRPTPGRGPRDGGRDRSPARGARRDPLRLWQPRAPRVLRLRDHARAWGPRRRRGAPARRG